MNATATNATATELLDALDRTALIPPIAAREPGFDVATAYEVSAEILRRRCARGERPIGRKLGFTNRTIWPEYGVSTPFWAHVYDRTVTFLDANVGSVAIGRLAQPRLEPEIVLHFRRTPPVTADEAELLSHIDWIAPGFEIVQSHFPGWRFEAADAIAAFGLHGALVVGPRRRTTDFSDPVVALRTFTVALAEGGVVRARGGGANVLDSPLLAAAHVLSVLKDQPRFAPIRAGEIVTTGTLTPLVAVQPGQTWSAEFSGIALDGLHVQIGA